MSRRFWSLVALAFSARARYGQACSSSPTVWQRCAVPARPGSGDCGLAIGPLALARLQFAPPPLTL
eukprot:4653952-Lingulodinium_polyedra.AAC.1